ncbi:MAG: ABC transporter ATP-binding protein [Spirochaetales bacterium]
MVKINNVTYRYSVESDEYSIKNLNLHIKKGEFIVLCGRSGCGKTTVTRLINGLIPHLYEGEMLGTVEVAEKNTKDVELSDLAGICGSVFQSPKSQFFNTDTTGELAFGCENLHLSKEEIGQRLEKAIKELSLGKLTNRDIFKLSGGEKQQIACGSIYATDPEIYVLDEPSSNMDAGAIVRFKNILQTLKNQGKTVIISEHRLYFLMDLADKFLYFSDGELKETFTPNQLHKFSTEELTLHGFRTTDLEKIMPANTKYESSDNIELKEIICTRAGKNVLEIQNLLLPTKSIIAIIGENGAGKSTFAEVLTGLLKAKGTVIFNAKPIKPKQRTEKSYMVMQDVNRQLFENSVQSEITLGAKKENKERAEQFMQSMDISEFKNRHPASLSGGQKQRVAICAAIAAEKEIMVYDEPTSGLDYRGMKNLCDVILSQQEKHATTMIITHDMELILGCCTHVLHLSEGTVKDFYTMNDDGLSKLKDFFIYNNEDSSMPRR